MKRNMQPLRSFSMQVTILSALAASLALVSLSCGGEPGNVKNDRAVIDVIDGKRTTANAAWWGFDPEDATSALQSAIDSGALRVVVPKMESDWIVRPLMLAGGQEIVFEQGVVVTAKKGEYKGRNDSVLNAFEKENIRLVGYGATIRMQKDDYMTDAYEKAEWRMVVNLRSCTNVEILGLTLADSGGDGIYLGVAGSRAYTRNVHIKDVVLDNNYRQGISVIGCESLLIEDCVFRNTWGTPPEAGIDLEPNHPGERLTDCTIRNCIFENNRGFGIQIYANPLDSTSEDLSVLFENCVVRSDYGGGIYAGAIRDNGPGGVIEFRNCRVERSAKWGLMVSDKSASRALVRFIDCSWENTATAEELENAAPIVLRGRKDRGVTALGGIEFKGCTLSDSFDRPFMTASLQGDNQSVAMISGDLTVANPNGVSMNLGDRTSGITLSTARP